MSLDFLIGESELSEEEIAWKSQDWDSVKKFAESYKTKAKNEYTETLKALVSDKRRLSTEYMDNYQQYLINSYFAKDTATLMHAAQLNLLYGTGSISDQMQFDYYLNVARQSPRLNWDGKADDEEIVQDIVSKVYQKMVARKYAVSMDRAREYVQYLKEDGLEEKTQALLAPMADEGLVKDAAPYATKAQISKALCIIEIWKNF